MPSGGGGRGTTTTNVNLPNVYQPQQQPAADTQFQNINNAITSQGQNAINALQWSPAQEYWGLAQSFGNQPFENLGPAGLAQGGANLAAGAAPDIFSRAFSGGGTLADTALGQLNYLGPLGANAFNPLYGGIVQNVGAGNPFLTQALQGANLGAGIGQGAANQAWGNSQNITNQLIPELYGYSRLAAGHAGDLLPFARAQADAAVAPIGDLQSGGRQLLQTGFDPQSLLRNSLEQHTTDQTRAALAASGLSGSPYAAGVEGDTLSNFDINWQNQQLSRQAQGLAGAASADTAAGNLAATGTSIYGQGEEALNRGLSTGGALAQAAAGLANTALGLGQGGSALAGSSAALPMGTWGNFNDQLLRAVQAQTQAGNQGAAGISTLLSGAGQGVTQGVGLQDQGANWSSQLSGLPFQTQMGQTGSYLDTLNNLIGIGNQNYGLGQQGINNIESYLGLGQSAAQNQNNVARSQLAQNQQAFGNQSSIYGGLNNILGGGGAFGNLLFGSGGLGGALGLGQGGLLGSGLGGLGGLFGGGGGGGGIADFFSGLSSLGEDLGPLAFAAAPFEF